MGERWLRLRRVLDQQFTVVIIVLLIFILIGGWISYTTFVAVEPTTEERTTTLWETTGEFSHSTVIEENSSVFPNGGRLTDRPVYFTRISPELIGRFRSSYAGTPSSTLTRNVSMSMIVQAVDPQGGDDSDVYWRTVRHLNGTTVEDVSPSEPITVSFTQNMTVINNQIDRINEQLGATVGETEVIIDITVDSRGTVDGREINETNSYSVPVELNRDTYRVAESKPVTESYETSRTETIEPTLGAGRRIGGPGLVVVSLIALGGLGVSRRRGVVGLSDAEQKRLAYQESREEFDDWISRLKLPAEAFDLPQGEADSLTALVDIAIDTNNSVIEDPEKGTLYVRHNGYLYSYQPPTQPSDVGAQDTDNDEDTDAETGGNVETEEMADQPTEQSDDESGESADDTKSNTGSMYGGIVRRIENQR